MRAGKKTDRILNFDLLHNALSRLTQIGITQKDLKRTLRYGHVMHSGRTRILQSSGRRYPIHWNHLKRLRTDAHLKHIILKKNGRIVIITLVKISYRPYRTASNSLRNNVIHAYFIG
jgi:hypothetical protein